MGKYKFHAINLIASTFEEKDIKFRVVSTEDREVIHAGFHVDCGPSVVVRFISVDNDNDVAIRIFGLISAIPKEKYARIIEACNVVNSTVRYLKFYVDGDGDLNVQYDLPLKTSDDSVGEAAVELFYRTMAILDEEYQIFMKALYTEETLSEPREDKSEELLRLLEELRDVIETDDDSEEEFDADDDEE